MLLLERFPAHEWREAFWRGQGKAAARSTPSHTGPHTTSNTVSFSNHSSGSPQASLLPQHQPKQQGGEPNPTTYVVDRPCSTPSAGTQCRPGPHTLLVNTSTGSLK